MIIDWSDLFSVTFSLFAVIDIVGNIPMLLSLKKKMGGMQEWKVTLISGVLMIAFLYAGENLLNLLGVDKHSFAVGGSIVIFLLGLEMVLGIEFFQSGSDTKSSIIVPISFPLIAGSGTLTTIISLTADYYQTTILLAILLNLVIIFAVLKSLNFLERILGPAGTIAIRKFFGVVLLAIAVKIFGSNVKALIK